MTNYLEAYKAYYFIRMKQYEGNADYANTYAAEKSMYEAINSCTTLEEFKGRIENKNDLLAIARVQDEQNIRLKHYEEINETVKAESCRCIIDKTKQVSNVTDLITMVNEEQHAANLAITTDTIYPFADFLYLENMEVWEQAEVPEMYKEKYAAYAKEEKTSIKNSYAAIEKEMNNWQPGWKFSFERIEEERHRRLLPYPNEVVAAQKEIIQQILNR